ncbi:MAG: flagellar hook-associated protein FlgL, partial [Thiobacillaceae bacterium]
MRVSSLTLSTATLAGIQNEQAAIARLTQQIAANQRILAPKDDPVRAARALELTDRIALREQHLANQDKARLALNYQSAVLQGIRQVLEHARGILMATSPSHDSSLREQYAQLIENDYRQLKGLANSRDPAGNYIFSGFKTNTEPYQHTQVAPGPGPSGTTTYTGDAGARNIEIDLGRSVRVNDNLNDVIDAGGTTDLLQMIDQIAIDLRTPTLTQAQLDAAVSRLNEALDDLGLIERRVAAAQQEIADTQAVTRALLNQE